MAFKQRQDFAVILGIELARKQIGASLQLRDIFHIEMALLHNKVMDSLEESVCIGGRDAQTDTAEVPHDQLVRI